MWHKKVITRHVNIYLSDFFIKMIITAFTAYLDISFLYIFKKIYIIYIKFGQSLLISYETRNIKGIIIL